MPPERGGHFCCVVGCHNSSSNSDCKFYAFPTKNPHYPHRNERRLKWVRLVKRTNADGSPWFPTNSSRICSCHFVGNEKSEHPESPSFNPTIFPQVYKKQNVNSSSASERFNRRMNKGTIDSSVAAEEDCNHDIPGNPDIHLNSTKKVTMDSGTMTDIFVYSDSDSSQLDHDVFICNRYMTPNSCEAETQACRPVHIVKKSSSTQTDRQSVMANERQGEKSLGFCGYSSIDNEGDLLDLSGVTMATFALLLRILSRDFDDKTSKITLENRLLMFLMRMKCGLTFSAIGVLFSVHRTTVSRLFYSTVSYLSGSCRNFVHWPTREVVEATMPSVFMESYSKCRVIIDCTEFRMEQPSTVEHRVQLFSHYKKGFRVKVLIGCTPAGFISFVSPSYGGRTTDAQITTESGFLDLLEFGDLVLADKGFPQIKTKLNESGKGVLFVMPPFLHNGEFTEEEVDETYQVAKVRIHVERVMQRIRTFKIVDMFSTDMMAYCDQIIFMCCVLVNLQPPIIQED